MKYFMSFQVFFYKSHFSLFLIGSAIIHCALLFSIPMKSINQNPAAAKLFEVDLVSRPKPPDPEPAKDQKALPEPAAAQKPAELSTETKALIPANTSAEKIFPPPAELPAEKEATVSLYSENKKSTKYSSYLQHLRQRIDSAWEYPEAAKERGIEGELTLVFSITKAGGLISVKLLQSSGHAVLDQEALRTLHSAAPFDPFPSSLSISRLNVHASFKYQFSSD